MKEKFKNFLNYLNISIKRPEMAVLPGNLAFFFMMMIIPLLTILGIIVSNIDIGKGSVYEAVFAYFPNNIPNLIISISGESSNAIGVGTLLVASLILASNGTYSMIVTSNSIYSVRKSSYIKNKAKSIFLLIVLLILTITLLFIPVVSTKVLNFIGSITHTNTGTNIYFGIYNFVKYPVAFLLVFVFVKILYKYSPSGGRKKRTSYGAVFTSVLLVIATFGYSFYIEYFNTYESFYGGISSLLFLMLYFYIISYIFVLGMSINYTRERIIKENDKAQ